MMFRCAAVALGLLLFAGGEAVAQNEGQIEIIGPDEPVTRVATRGANFLEIEIGARANALSGAGTVVSEGVHALYWNPAGVAGIESFSVGGSYQELYEDTGIEQFYLGAALPILGGVLGVNVNSLSSGDIPRTTESTPSGALVGLGPTFDWNATAIGTYYARRITDRLQLGGGFKFISEGIERATADYFAVDLGAKFSTGIYGTTLAASVGNLGPSGEFSGSLIESTISETNQDVFETGRELEFQFDTRSAELPTYFRIGFATDLSGGANALVSTNPDHRVTTYLDFFDSVDTDIQPTVALEYAFRDIVFLRGGKRWYNETFADRDFADGLSGGFGVRLPLLGRSASFDYAYTSLGALENKQIFSFELGAF